MAHGVPYQTHGQYFLSNEQTVPLLLYLLKVAWWRRQMETFSALQALCAGNSPATGEFPYKG